MYQAQNSRYSHWIITHHTEDADRHKNTYVNTHTITAMQHHRYAIQDPSVNSLSNNKNSRQRQIVNTNPAQFHLSVHFISAATLFAHPRSQHAAACKAVGLQTRLTLHAHAAGKQQHAQTLTQLWGSCSRGMKKTNKPFFFNTYSTTKPLAFCFPKQETCLWAPEPLPKDNSMRRADKPFPPTTDLNIDDGGGGVVARGWGRRNSNQKTRGFAALAGQGEKQFLCPSESTLVQTCLCRTPLCMYCMHPDKCAR